MSNNSSIILEDLTSHEAVRTVKLILYGVILLFSISGNLLVICSIVKFRRQRTFPNVFVLNLSLCDICLVTLSIPVAIINDETGTFYFGRIGCYALWPLATMAMNSVVLTLLTIAVERYIAIVHPFSFVLTKKKITCILVILHSFSLLSVIPYASHLTLADGDYPKCNETWSRTPRRIYTVFLFLIQYGIPLPVIVCLSAIAWNRIRVQNCETIRIAEQHSAAVAARYAQLVQQNGVNGTALKSQTRPRRVSVINGLRRKITAKLSVSEYSNETSLERHKQTKRTLKMFIMVAIVFGVCMLPSQLVWLLTDFGTSPSDIVIFICYMLTYTNSVLNPWIYGGANSSFRKAYRQMLWGKRCNDYQLNSEFRKTTVVSAKSGMLSCGPTEQANGFSWIYDTWKANGDASGKNGSATGVYQNIDNQIQHDSLHTFTTGIKTRRDVWHCKDHGSYERRLSHHTLEKLKLLHETIL